MMTTVALSMGQEKTRWKWEQWHDKAREFYQNVVWLKRLWGGDSYIQQAQPRMAHHHADPNTMDIDKINLSPAERAEHMQNHKCFICHKEGHLSKYPGYPQGGKPPLKPNPWPPWRAQSTREVSTNSWVTDFMKKEGITLDQVIDLLEPYCRSSGGAQEWPVEEEVLAKVATTQKDFLTSLLPKDTWSILVTTSRHSITIPVMLYKLENGKIPEMATLINSGATICCIDLHLIWRMKWPLEKLPQPMYAWNTERTTNSGGMIHHHVTVMLGTGRYKCRLELAGDPEWYQWWGQVLRGPEYGFKWGLVREQGVKVVQVRTKLKLQVCTTRVYIG